MTGKLALLLGIAMLMLHGSNALECDPWETKFRFRVEVEFKSQKIKSYAISRERASSDKTYVEKHDSLDVSGSVSASAGVPGIAEVSGSVSAAYAHANTLITNNERSGSWKESKTRDFQDGWHIFRNVKTLITIDGSTATTEEEVYKETGEGHEDDDDLWNRAIKYLKRRFKDPGDEKNIRGNVYETEKCLDIGCTEYKRLSTRRRNSQIPTSGLHDCDKVDSRWANGQNEGRTAKDWVGPNWYRFSSFAGRRLPEKPVPENHCGTHVGGWLQGSHPVTKGETVSRTVCFNRNSEQSLDTCGKVGGVWGGVPIKIRHCGQYFLYYLPDVPTCNVGYCAQ